MTAPEQPGPPRPLEQRIADTLRLLETSVDAWVATADPASGRPWMVPLSFAWTGSVLVLGTGAHSTTVRNATAQPWVRLGIGAVRDVVLVHGRASVVAMADVDKAEADLFAERSGFDPRDLSNPYAYLRVTPRRIQAWREENELDDREVMVDGRWLAGARKPSAPGVGDDDVSMSELAPAQDVHPFVE